MKTKKAKAVRYDEIQGKTVAGTGYGFNNMLIAFTDGTVLALTLDGDSQIAFAQGRDIDLMSSQWAGEANEAGLIDHADYCESRKRQDDARIKRLEQELANLKGK